MASKVKKDSIVRFKPRNNRKHKKTSIGSSPQSRPKNKHKRRNAGKVAYRGQGR